MSAIEQHHKAFARAVVALAREHQMDRLKLDFKTGFNHPSGSIFGECITMTWNTGRHSDVNNIFLECRASEGIEER
jgi:hypothetical protein